MGASYRHLLQLPMVACAAWALAACSAPEEPSSAAPQNGANGAAAGLIDPGVFDTTASIRELMDVLIDPHADFIWDAVRYELDTDGELAYLPETDDDWAELRASALMLLEGANALMVPGRRAAPQGATADDPAFEYTPAEVEGRMRASWSAWTTAARSLQDAAAQVLDAVESRDIDALFDSGGVVYESCEGCHSRYWYRE